MGKARSDREPRALPALLSPVVVVLGIWAMSKLLPALAMLGVRPALAVAEVVLVVPGLVAAALMRVPLGASIGLRRIDRRSLLLSLVAGGALWAASLGLFELQFAVWRPPEGYLEAFRRLHQALRPAGPLDALFSVAAIAMVPAACEELLFRGIVLPSFEAPLGGPAATVLSALLFGLIHLDSTSAGSHSFYRVPFAFAVGIGLGALRLRTGSLVPPLVAHALLNTVTFVAVPLTDDPSRGLPESQPLIGLLLLVAGSIVSVAVLKALRPPRS